MIAFIDDDALAHPEWLAAILRAFDAAPQAAVAGGPVAPIWLMPRPRWIDGWHEGFLSIVDRGSEPRMLADDEWLAGTNIAFRTDVLRRMGPFPEYLGRRPSALLGNEEIAVVARIRSDGHAVCYDPKIAVRHHVHVDRMEQSWMRRRVAWQAFSDSLLDEPPARGAAGALWRQISRYLERLPPAYRGFAGLLRDEVDPAMSRAQCEAIAALIGILTHHGKSLDSHLRADDPSPG